MNRRHFLQLLGIAPLAFDPHRVYFDMGRKLFLPDPKIHISEIGMWPDPIDPVLEQLDAITQKYIDGQLASTVFGPAEMFKHLRDWQSKPLEQRPYTRHTPTGLGIIIP